MAFYGNQYYSPSPRGFATPQPHWYGPRHHHHQHRHQHDQAPYHYYNAALEDDYASPQSIDEEERLALAHLHAIQRRREAERAAIERDAAIRLQREAAITRAIEVEKQRRLAIAREIEREREREVERHHRENAIRIAIHQQHQRQQRREREAALASIAKQREAYKEQHIARRRALHEHQARACAKHCEGRRQVQAQADSPSAAETDAGLEAMNSLFGSLFGVRFAPEAEPEHKAEEKKQEATPIAKKDTPSPAPVTKSTESAPKEPAQSTEQVFPEAINDILSHFLGLRVDQAGESTAPSPTDNKVPAGLNEFLSHFGLVFEPEEPTKQESPASAPVNAADPPEAPLPAVAPTPTPAPAPVVKSTHTTSSCSRNVNAKAGASCNRSSAASASTSSAAAGARADTNETPITAFLNGVADLPPFVRDILGNVELAFKEEMKKGGEEMKQEEQEVKGKGKGVAQGERASNPVKATPPPAAAAESTTTSTQSSTDSLAQLSSIAHDLHLVRESFTFPSTLSFAPSPSGEQQQPAPALLFNKTNSGYHAQTHKLLQLLLAADGIQSAGDRDVRRKRKALVREVEGEIEALEKRRDDVWEQVRVAREEKGQQAVEGEYEVPSDAESTSTSTSTTSRSSRAASVVDASEDLTADLAVDEVVVVNAPQSDTEVNVTAAGNNGSEGEDVHIEVTSVSNPSRDAAESPAAVEAEVQGYKVDTDADDNEGDAPKSFAEAVKKDTDTVVKALVVKDEDKKEEEASADKEKEVKEEGYELL